MKHHVFQPILISPFKGTRAMWVPVLFFCHVVMGLAPCCLTNLIIRDNLLTPFIGYWWSKSCQFSLMFFSREKGTQYREKRNNGTYIILRHCSLFRLLPLHLLFSSVLIFRGAGKSVFNAESFQLTTSIVNIPSRHLKYKNL